MVFKKILIVKTDSLRAGILNKKRCQGKREKDAKKLAWHLILIKLPSATRNPFENHHGWTVFWTSQSF